MAVHMYFPHEFMWNHNFVDIIEHDVRNHTLVVDHAKLNLTTPCLQCDAFAAPVAI